MNEEQFLVACPNPACQMVIIVEQLNCCIFRCGVFKETFQQIPPHLSKIDCLDLIDRKLIYGCATPFRVINRTAEKCDYI